MVRIHERIGDKRTDFSNQASCQLIPSTLHSDVFTVRHDSQKRSLLASVAAGFSPSPGSNQQRLYLPLCQPLTTPGGTELKDYLTMNDAMLDNKRVLVRVDLNSPMDPSGNILDDKRIKSHLERLRALEDCQVVLMAHQSRAGKKDYTTLEADARLATRLLCRDVAYIDNIFGSHAQQAIKSMVPGEVLLLENTRFYAEENMNRSPADHAKSHMVKKRHRYLIFS